MTGGQYWLVGTVSWEERHKAHGASESHLAPQERGTFCLGFLFLLHIYR